MFLYADGLIQWVWSHDHVGTAAQVGINAGDGVRFFSHPDALTIQLFSITETSNIETPGVWLFRVDGEGDISRGCNITSSGTYYKLYTDLNYNLCYTSTLLALNSCVHA